MKQEWVILDDSAPPAMYTSNKGFSVIDPNNR